MRYVRYLRASNSVVFMGKARAEGNARKSSLNTGVELLTALSQSKGTALRSSVGKNQNIITGYVA